MGHVYVVISECNVHFHLSRQAPRPNMSSGTLSKDEELLANIQAIYATLSPGRLPPPITPLASLTRANSRNQATWSALLPSGGTSVP